MYGAMEDTTLADARYQFEVNLFGMAYLTQRFCLVCVKNAGSNYQYFINGWENLYTTW